jgi:beta-xylosidase
MQKNIHIIGAVTAALSAVILLSTTLSTNAAQSTASPITWTDNFSSSSLDSHWTWIREVPTYWSLSARPGFLRITTQQAFSSVNNLLVQPSPEGAYEIRTRVIFTPTENYQIAGVEIYQDDINFVALGRAYCDTPPPDCVGNGIYFDYIEDGNLGNDNFAMTTSLQGDAYLKLIRQTNVYTGYVSVDGESWTLVGTHTIAITPTKVGLKASAQIEGAAEIPADFDFFTLIDNSHRIYLPLIFK